MDLATKRDTAAVTAVYRDYETNLFCLWGLRIFQPPINIITQVEPLLDWLFRAQRIGICAFDEYQFEATRARLEANGYNNKLMPINQRTLMKTATNTLHAHCTEKQVRLFPDPDLRSHFAWCAVRYTEQGPHITKQNQSRPIDGVVSLAMALLVATGEVGFASHPSYTASKQGRSALLYP